MGQQVGGDGWVLLLTLASGGRAIEASFGIGEGREQNSDGGNGNKPRS